VGVMLIHADGRTGGHDENKRRFSRVCKRPQKLKKNIADVTETTCSRLWSVALWYNNGYFLLVTLYSTKKYHATQVGYWSRDFYRM